MSNIYDGMQIEKAGLTFVVNFPSDCYFDPPWENSDGHGPVRKSTKRHVDGYSDKRPCERPLNSPTRNEYQFYYDWQAAVKIAKKDGWNAKPYDAPKCIERAVLADFKYLAGYLNDDWNYIGVTVDLLNEEGEKVDGYDGILWGIESNAGDYLLTVANELVDEIISQIENEKKQERVNNRFYDAMQCGL